MQYDYSMDDDQVRRQVFWLLQRLSSYSLWQRKHDAWAIFAEAFETAVKTWPEDDPEALNADLLVPIYRVLNLYEAGLIELEKGHRHVWRLDGELRQLYRPEHLAVSDLFRACHERGVQVDPYPPKVDELSRLRQASEYWVDNVVYEPSRGVARIYDADTLLRPSGYKYEFYTLPYPVFPRNLPPVPERQDVIISTGDEVPCDGIWEPVSVRYDHKWLIVRTEIQGFRNRGCFNYLLRGTKAPYINAVEFGEIQVNPVQWRLLWEDQRYCDGVIPDESGYFLKELPEQKHLTAWTHETCPHSGQWAAFMEGRIEYEQVVQGRQLPHWVDRQGQRHRVEWTLLKRDDGGSVHIDGV